MYMQFMTNRMKLRIQAIVSLKNALLPGFCQDMVCDQCPLYLETRHEPCEWMKTYEAIERMELQLLKSNGG